MRNEAIRRDCQVCKRSPFSRGNLVDLQQCLASSKCEAKETLLHALIQDAMDAGTRFDHGCKDVERGDFEKSSQLWSVERHRIVSLAQVVKEKADTKWLTCMSLLSRTRHPRALPPEASACSCSLCWDQIRLRAPFLQE